MPKVPTVDNFGAAPNPIPQVQVRNAASEEMFTAGARQMQQFGGAVQRVGGQMGDIALDIQQRANQLRVDDAIDKTLNEELRLTFDGEVGFQNLKGLAALERPSGKPMTEEYTEKFQQTISSIAQGLGNDAQREAFTREANKRVLRFRENAMRHVGNEFRTYAASVREGTIANRINEIGLNYNNPDVVNEAVDSIRAAAFDLAQQKGLSATEAEAQARKFTSQAHMSAVTAALQNNNVKYADAYLKRYASQMDADDLLRAQGVMTKQLDAQLAVEVVNDVFREVAPAIDPSNIDRAFNILINTESNGRQFDKDGNPLTSSAGAIGIAQVMPDTAPEAAALAGVEWDEERYKTDPTYNMQLGKAYFEKQLKDFDGNLAKAYAAYNAGPGTVSKAIKAAEKDGKPAEWLSYTRQFQSEEKHAETVNYVTKNMREFGSGGGGAGKRPTLYDVQQQVRDRVGTDSPERLQTALELAEKQYNAQTKAIAQREEQAVSDAMQALIQNGGGYADLPIAIRSAIPTQKVGAVIDFAKKLAAGEDVKTDWQAYYELKANPQVLAQTNLMALRDKLNDSEFRELVKEQQDLRSGGQTQMSALRSEEQLIKQYLTDAGFKSNAASYEKRVGQVWSAYTAQVRTQEAQMGRKLNPVEKEQTLARLMTTVEVDGWWGNPQVPAAAVTDADGVVIPNSEREMIVSSLVKAGKPATDQNIRAVYLRSKMGQ